VRGTVAPTQPGGSQLKFVAQQYYGGSWHTASTGTFPIESSGSAYAVLYQTVRGNYRLKVVFSGNVINLGCSSGWAYLRVT
jgi:hypothetical protein